MPLIPNPPINSKQSDDKSGKPSVVWSSWYARITALINSLTTDFAPTSATYITKTPNLELANEQALSLLNSGFLKVTTATGNLSSTGNTLIQDSDLSSSGVLAGTYGSPTEISQITVNTKGRITAASSVTISGTVPGGSASGDLSGTYPSPLVVKLNGLSLNQGGAGHVLLSGAADVPVWSTPTYPSTNGSSGTILRSDGTNNIYSSWTIAASFAQGDIVYANASNTIVALNKNTTATRYLSNQGTNNDPSWNQVNLTNGVTGTLPVANGGNGVSSLPSASYYQNAATTLATSAFTKILFQVSDWDTGSYMSSSRYTPLVAGTYLVNTGYYLASPITNTQYQLQIQKNGAAITNHSVTSMAGTGLLSISGTKLVQMNGSTDYLEIFGYNGSGASTIATTGNQDTFFQVSWIGP